MQTTVKVTLEFLVCHGTEPMSERDIDVQVKLPKGTKLLGGIDQEVDLDLDEHAPHYGVCDWCDLETSLNEDSLCRACEKEDNEDEDEDEDDCDEPNE